MKKYLLAFLFLFVAMVTFSAISPTIDKGITPEAFAKNQVSPVPGSITFMVPQSLPSFPIFYTGYFTTRWGFPEFHTDRWPNVVDDEYRWSDYNNGYKGCGPGLTPLYRFFDDGTFEVWQGSPQVLVETGMWSQP